MTIEDISNQPIKEQVERITGLFNSYDYYTKIFTKAREQGKTRELRKLEEMSVFDSELEISMTVGGEKVNFKIKIPHYNGEALEYWGMEEESKEVSREAWRMYKQKFNFFGRLGLTLMVDYNLFG